MNKSHLNIKKRKIAVVTTSVLQVKFFLIPFLETIAKDFDVTLILKNDYPSILNSISLPIQIRLIPIERTINPYKDLLALIYLIRIFLFERFDLVHSMNPKAGLLAMIASKIAKVDKRVHTFQGEVWANKKGVTRALLKFLDTITSYCATDLTVVSNSERNVLIAEGVIKTKKSRVIGSGSITGVNTQKYSPSPIIRNQLRRKYLIAPSTLVFLYLGRITNDKGISELINAFERLKNERSDIHLFIVGPDEGNLLKSINDRLSSLKESYTILDYTDTPEIYYSASDVNVLPSYREGFPISILEAASMEIPTIGSNIYGISDAIVDNQTGLLFKVRNYEDLYSKMKFLVENPEFCKKLGRNGRLRVKDQFEQINVITLLKKYYFELLKL